MAQTVVAVMLFHQYIALNSVSEIHKNQLIACNELIEQSNIVNIIG
jgi:hypothetical protein